MASAKDSSRALRRRPFSTWMRRLANFKTSHTHNSNPYPLAGSTRAKSVQKSRHSSHSLSQNRRSASLSYESQLHKSRPATLATTADTTISDTAHSGAGTSATVAKTDDHNSTFSSPAQSLRSMTTTLTTMQSAAPPMNGTTSNNLHSPTQSSSNHPSVNQFAQPAPAIPAHLAPHTHPTTYHTATSNNLLTDDASILTLASSSRMHRGRRNSFDTNASMRALAPASMFGGSRESLPLSVLSGTILYGPGTGADSASIRDGYSYSVPSRPGLAAGGGGGGGGGGERASLISASGVAAPVLASERNSYIGKPAAADGASVRSGLLGGSSSVGAAGGHARNDSLSGSIGGNNMA